MRCTTSFAPFRVTSALLALAAAPAWAGAEDTQVWSTFTLVGSPLERVDASIEVSPRLRSGQVGGDQLLARMQADYRATPWLTLAGGIAYVEFAGGNELRLHQQAIVTVGRLAFRTRLEERFFAGAEQTELRLRQRAQASFPLATRTTILVAGEVLAIIRPRNPRAEARIEQWRGQLVLRHRWTEHLDLSTGYMFLHFPLQGGPDRTSHVPLLSLTYRL